MCVSKFHGGAVGCSRRNLHLVLRQVEATLKAAWNAVKLS